MKKLTFQKIDKVKNINVRMEKLTQKEQGYLFGLFEGDGYKYHEIKNRRYRIDFFLNSIRDIKIIDFLSYLLKKLNLNVQIYQDKRFNCKRITVYSKGFFDKIEKNIELRNKSKEFNIGFVSGLIDSEGYVNHKKSMIMIINTNHKMLERCQKFLSSIEIKSSISKRKKSEKEILDSYRMYISVNFKRLKHLSLKAGAGLPDSGVETR